MQSESHSYGLSNNNAGHKQLLKELSKLDRPFVVCEATGGYERTLLAALHEAEVAVCLINPARVRAFATSDDIRAKTDKIDAKVLLRFTQQKNWKAMVAPTKQQQQITALLDRRSHLSEMTHLKRNRMVALAGLAPYNRDSGKSHAKRSIKGGFVPKSENVSIWPLNTTP